jgi:flagellar motor switch protein FliG
MAEGSKPKAAIKPSSKRPKDYRNLTGRQKAAIFLVSLGSEISSEIFNALNW